jgi:hypothetical protein
MKNHLLVFITFLAKGYKFLTPKPVPISYFDKPALYFFCHHFYARWLANGNV